MSLQEHYGSREAGCIREDGKRCYSPLVSNPQRSSTVSCTSCRKFAFSGTNVILRLIITDESHTLGDSATAILDITLNVATVKSPTNHSHPCWRERGRRSFALYFTPDLLSVESQDIPIDVALTCINIGDTARHRICRRWRFLNPQPVVICLNVVIYTHL
ncbi:hypothetical protein A0H81_12702 [Grifola frondosa]|uniref:Uncharacterized protein n=1 Tax=Grifola frondosa TaxID=5627 RepID=A0A1C7LRM4_GRIFR|nr:hypothetical protein A0H81_12702 [Grifola frondosa]